MPVNLAWQLTRAKYDEKCHAIVSSFPNSIGRQSIAPFQLPQTSHWSGMDARHPIGALRNCVRWYAPADGLIGLCEQREFYEGVLWASSYANVIVG